MDSSAITEEQADNFLRCDLRAAEKAVSNLVTVPLSQNQFDALVSWTYNLGAGNLKKSTLLKKLNQGLYCEVPAEFLRWIYAGGKKLKGLEIRRQKEADLFAAAVEGTQ